MTITAGFIIGVISLGITILSAICGIFMWVFNIKAKGEANAVQLQNSIELLNTSDKLKEEQFKTNIELLHTKANLKEQQLQSSIDILNTKLEHANQYIVHLIDEGKNLKLIHGQFQVVQSSMQGNIIEIGTVQKGMVGSIEEVKKLIIDKLHTKAA